MVGRWGELGFGLRGRVAIWEVALETIADNPWLGVGPEMFLVEYSERVSADTVRGFGREGVTDRAHSGLLDFAVSFGIPAAVLYAAVLAAVCATAVKAWQANGPCPPPWAPDYWPMWCNSRCCSPTPLSIRCSGC